MSLLLLFETNYAEPQNVVPLSIWGHAAASGSCPLYICGSMRASGCVSLYIGSAATKHQGINLFLQGIIPRPASGHLPLFVQGVGSGLHGIGNSVPLFLEATHGNRLTPSMPLFLAGAAMDRASANLNLFVQGTAYTLNSGLTLFLNNTVPGGTITLFIQGSGVTPGALPYNQGLSLFLKRPDEWGMTLFLAGPGATTTAHVPLYIQGSMPLTNTMPLVMPNVIGQKTKGVNLFARGF